MRLILLLCCLAPLAQAASSSDIRDAVRDVYRDAAKQRDLWTMLQVEAWCAANDVRTRDHVFGRGAVAGSPLFGCPTDIAYAYDCGEVVVAIAGGMVYNWSADSRPLRPATRFDHGCNIRACSNDGRFVFIGHYRRDVDDRKFHLQASIVDCLNQRVMQRWQVDLPADHRHNYDAAIADDGSAVLVGFLATDDPASADFCYLFRTGRKGPDRVADRINPQAIGQNGRWFVASENRADGRIVLNTGKQDIPLRRWIDGPSNRLAFIDDQADAVKIVSDAGRITPLALPFAITDRSDIFDAGPWLAVDSRADGSEVDEVDIFGASNKRWVAGPHAFFAWSELDKADQASATVSGNGVLVNDHAHPTAVLTWAGGRCDRLVIDPTSESGLRVEPVIDYGERTIAWVSDNGWHYEFELHADQDRRDALVTAAGIETWEGPKQRYHQFGPGRSLAMKNWSDPDTFRLIIHHPDPDQRKAIPVNLPANSHHLRYDVYGRRAYAYRGTVWHAFDLQTGQAAGVFDEEKQPGFRPDFVMPWAPNRPSRFVFAGSRIFAKALPADLDWEQHPELMQFQDALHVPGGMALTTRSGHLLLYKDSRGDYEPLAALDASDLRLMQGQSIDLMVVDPDRHQVVAMLEQGRRFKDLGQRKPEMPAWPPEEGKRKVSGKRFDLGRYGQVSWPEAAALQPQLIRSHSGASDLLLVTLSCVIAIDERDMARLLAMFKD